MKNPLNLNPDLNQQIYSAFGTLGSGIDFLLNQCSSIQTSIIDIIPFIPKDNIKKSNPPAPIRSKLKKQAEIIARWEEDNLRKQNEKLKPKATILYSDSQIQELKNERYKEALSLFQKISGDNVTQQEIKLITLLHEHRLKLIGEVLNDKSEIDKLDKIDKILNYGGDFYQDLDLLYNIYDLTEKKFNPQLDLPIQSPNASSPSINREDRFPISSNAFLSYPPRQKDLNAIADKKTKEELLFRLNYFKYSCLGVLKSGVEKSHKIGALKELIEEQSDLVRRKFKVKHQEFDCKIRKVIEIFVHKKFQEIIKVERSQQIPMEEEDLKQKEKYLKKISDQILESYKSNLADASMKEKPESYELPQIKEENKIKIEQEYITNLKNLMKEKIYQFATEEMSFYEGIKLAEKMQSIATDSSFSVNPERLTPPPSPRSREGAPSPPPPLITEPRIPAPRR